MKDIGRKSEFWSTWRIIGAVVLLFFGGKLLLCLHLSLIGRAVPGYTGTLKSEIVPDASEPVLYVYFVEGEDALHRRSDPWRGWRRGLQWGGQEVSIIYSPILPRVHVLSTTRGLSQPGALWREADYLLRLGLRPAWQPDNGPLLHLERSW